MGKHHLPVALTKRRSECDTVPLGANALPRVLQASSELPQNVFAYEALHSFVRARHGRGQIGKPCAQARKLFPPNAHCLEAFPHRRKMPSAASRRTASEPSAEKASLLHGDFFLHLRPEISPEEQEEVENVKNDQKKGPKYNLYSSVFFSR